jgi:hypothetical protein
MWMTFLSLENAYMLTILGMGEYYFGGNIEFLGEVWKNQGLGLVLSAITYAQNVIPKFEGARSLSPSRHP